MPQSDPAAHKISEACRLLEETQRHCETAQLQQLESSIIQSTALVRAVMQENCTDTLSTELRNALDRYLSLSRELSDQIRLRRTRVKDEFLSLGNRARLNDKYSKIA